MSTTNEESTVSSSKPQRLLYIDDDAGLATLFKRRLQRVGYVIELAPDGRTGLEMVRSSRYDLLCVDQKMPGMSGLEVIQVLVDEGALPPTIMITGQGDETVAVEAMKLGASDYVIKDVDGRYLELIPAIIERAVTKQRLLEAKQRAEDALKRANEILEEKVEERTQELRRSEERFRAIFETARDCIFVKDLSLKYTHVNPAMERLLERPAAQIMGATDDSIYGEKTARQLAEVEQRVLLGELIEQEHTRPVKGGLATFHDIRVPLTDNSGNIVGLCGISRDITERKKTLSEIHVMADNGPTSPVMRTTLASARLAADTDSVILLLGESGAGKDYLARFVHDHSKRAAGPFFSINCAAVAPELAESELFGHEPGAFTGAGGRKRGLLELAEGGTLLLNEIGELPLRLQAKLLTFLDTRSFTRVGGEKSIPVNARLMAATNRELEKEVERGRFRTDLYYRLNVLSITVPPLRERREELPYMVHRIVEQLTAEMQLPHVPAVDSSTMHTLSTYHWPGNIRELRNVLERALILSGSDRITLGALEAEAAPQGTWSYAVTFPENKSLTDVTDEVKRALIGEALNRTSGSKQGAADLLQISRFTLFRLIKALEMDVG